MLLALLLHSLILSEEKSQGSAGEMVCTAATKPCQPLIPDFPFRTRDAMNAHETHELNVHDRTVPA